MKLEKCRTCSKTVERNHLDGGGLECHGAPPTPVLVPQQGPMGMGVALAAMYPIVTAESVGCAAHEPEPKSAGLPLITS